MALFNENLGDFPTAVHVSADIFKVGTDEMSPPLRRIKEIYDRYNLKLPDGEWFNFNIGAIDVLEKLCLATIPYIFLSEHSCEASTPQDISKHLHIEPSGNPERITLQGHDEYTIKFSHLSDVASNNGYNVIRGRMADYIEPDFSDRVMAALRSTISANDEYEIIRQFIYDLYKYEYLILIRKEGTL
jgi:hypothetical protein